MVWRSLLVTGDIIETKDWKKHNGHWVEISTSSSKLQSDMFGRWWLRMMKKHPKVSYSRMWAICWSSENLNKSGRSPKWFRVCGSAALLSFWVKIAACAFVALNCQRRKMESGCHKRDIFEIFSKDMRLKKEISIRSQRLCPSWRKRTWKVNLTLKIYARLSRLLENYFGWAPERDRT